MVTSTAFKLTSALKLAAKLSLAETKLSRSVSEANRLELTNEIRDLTLQLELLNNYTLME